MQKNTIILAIVILVIGVGAFVMLQSRFQSGDQDSAAHTVRDESSPGIIEGSLNQLLAQNASLKCTFTHDSVAGLSEGTMHISGEDVRGDFEVTRPDGSIIDSSLIRVGNTNYVWSSEQEQGMKMTVNYADDQTVTTENTDDVFASLEDENISYSCAPWIVDESLFVPPTDIEFIDFSAQMEQFQQPPNLEPNADACAVCDTVPAEARQQCLDAIGCS